MRIIILFIAVLFSSNVRAQREIISLNDDWSFRLSQDYALKQSKRLDLPHTWNAQDALSGNINYLRGIGNYEKTVLVPNSWKGKRLFIKFDGVNTIASIFINGKFLGQHKGGYTAFIFELTNVVNYGEQNNIMVRVNNSPQLDVMPLVGDFNIYGGIYRDVNLILTNNTCISPLDYASSGVYLTQEKVSEKEAFINAKVLISKFKPTEKTTKLSLKILQNRKVIYEVIKTLLPSKNNLDTILNIPLLVKNPHLWNGKEEPFIYDVEVNLLADGEIIDAVKQPLGLRYYHVDKEKGFFLNGKRLEIHGVSRHQDRAEIGSALKNQDHDHDLSIMNDMGVNAIRLSHYPQAPYFYDLLDKNGFIVWSEIPFIGPGGYADKGFINEIEFKQNGKEQLKEMIRQNYNHPSILFWGLFNELKETGDNPNDYIKELNALAHHEDATRLTTAASNIEGELNKVTDIMAWNKYLGWYSGKPNELGNWLDKLHQKNAELKIGISEYGAGASVLHQQDSLSKPTPNSWWHPENWQTYYHIENWKIISARPYVWGSFVWVMFDFGAAHRTEGDKAGINDKGLVTIDRKIKKDAFYFYKANWNKSEKMVYITNKRNNLRTKSTTEISVFTNASGVELLINGKSLGKKSTDLYGTIVWNDIKLIDGDNFIEARTTDFKNNILDSCHWNLAKPVSIKK